MSELTVLCFGGCQDRLGVIAVIGRTKGEERRVTDPQSFPKWKRLSVEQIHPLIELGMDRSGCQSLIRAFGHEVHPRPNCMRCPFMSDIEVVWLYRFHPDVYADWVRQEANKLRSNAHAKRNCGVWPDAPLQTVVERALNKFGSMADEELIILQDESRTHSCEQILN